jgi:hypothetical protein
MSRSRPCAAASVTARTTIQDLFPGLALRSCNSACRFASRTFGGRIVHISCIRNLRNLASSANHGARAVLAFGFSASLAVRHEFVSGTHQAFASIPIVEDASTWCGCAKSIPGDASLFAERSARFRIAASSTSATLMLQGLRPHCSMVRAPTGTATAGVTGR